MTNPYLAYGLLIQAALEGIKEQRVLPGAADFNLFRADEETLKQFQILPESLAEAKKLAGASTFVRSHLPEELLEIYLK